MEYAIRVIREVCNNPPPNYHKTERGYECWFNYYGVIAFDGLNEAYQQMAKHKETFKLPEWDYEVREYNDTMKGL